MNKNRQIGWIICEEAGPPLGDVTITRDPNNPRRVMGKGKLQRAEIKNRNGRFYAKSELFPQVESIRVKEMRDVGKGVPSENGHPMSTELARQSTIDPNNVVAYFHSIWTEGDYIWATFRGSNLAIGEAFDLDLRDGYKPAWSLRAVGRVEATNRGAEVKDMSAITWDRVYFPSHPEAYTESVSGILVPNNEIKQLRTPIPEQTQKIMECGIMEPIHNNQVINYIKSQSHNFKHVTECFEVLYDSISYNEETNLITLKDKANGVIYNINLENYITNELREY